ncbi:MAG TPA: beta-L-arabinofuranosidase domain-containing protein, partial [Steroidobacteraceae bacterium]|nr:beta-L-arabinofuranosidase domain-containing protein [Steroidobacteraceae bacterium]
RYLDAARKIGDLFCRTLAAGIDITELGNHFGLSATVLMDPIVELYFATGEQRYLDLARLILEQAERHPRSAMVTRALAGADASEIATGKAYQLLWNMVGVAKLYRATGEPLLLEALTKLWSNVRDHHLTLGGGPWGGVAHRSREVFNAAGTFSPHAYVETCSILAWVQLSRELLSISGDARYAEEIERSAFNDLLGAQAPNGEDWCYYSFPNGRRVHTTYWRCCKSSGALALEELPSLLYGVTREGDIAVNLFAPSDFEHRLPCGTAVRLEQRTRFPFEGEIEIHVMPEQPSRFAVGVRIPHWATDRIDVRVNDSVIAGAPAGQYLSIDREWRRDDVITLKLPLHPRVHRMIHRNVQESRAPDGSAVAQEVLHFEYIAASRGPLVYATGLIDGYKLEETLRLSDAPQDEWLRAVPATAEEGADLELRPLDRAPIIFSPYYRAGGRGDRAWRLTWMPLAPELR